MRQTLWTENVISNSNNELFKAVDYLHIHVIPKENTDILQRKYRVSGKGMEDTWREQLTDQSKYIIIDPEDLTTPISSDYIELTTYLSKRYWSK